MSLSPSLELQRVFLKALKADQPLAEIMDGVRVFDHVDDNARFPYIQIGDDQTLDNSTTDYQSSEIYSRVHIWSRRPGHVEAKKIGARVRDLLDKRHEMIGFYITVHTFLSEDFFVTEKAEEIHGVLQFRFLIWKNT